MTDEMDELEKLLKMDAPPPSDAARKSAISSGMEAFDQKFVKTSQGTSFGERLMDAVRTFHITLTQGDPMKRRQIIGGGLIAALGVLMLTSTSMTTLVPQNLDISGAGSTVSKHAPERLVQTTQGVSAGELPTAAVQAPVGSASNRIEADTVNQMRKAEESARIKLESREPVPMAKPVPEAKKAQFGAMAQSAPQEMLKNFAKDDRAADKVAAPMKEKAMAVPAVPPAPAPSFNAATSSVIGNVAGGASMRMIAPAPGVVVQPMPVPPSDAVIVNSYQDEGRDQFEHVKVNPMKVAKEEPVSTFSIDVDTSSYSFMRASLNNNVLPQKDSVRIEELVNYFPYEYETPKDKETPFKSNVSVMPTPWNNKTKLIHIGIKGYQIDQKEKPKANLVFLVDTSGSMNAPNKLPLLKNSLKMLVDSLKPEDTVAIVTYAGSAGVALEPTSVKDKAKILSSIDTFNAGGSTAGAEGIRQAYQLAEKNFDKSGVNRVILATDGDFNVGITNPEELKSFVERQRSTGIFLSVLGFGQGNYNDAMMQKLAQNGNGVAAYIDSLSEARKILVDEASSTLFTIAKDVKIQVEFNPAKVAEYRLIGYETRMLNREDFNNDKVDAGDIGAGHTVTALYEITPAGSDAKLVDDLRYSQKKEAEKPTDKSPDANTSDEYAFVKIRYKQPDGDTSKLITTPVDSKVEFKELASAPQEARFATAVAAYGQLLKGDPYTQSFSFDDVINLAQGAKGSDNYGYRAEFINLVRLAANAPKLQPQQINNGYYR